jgi:tripartite-type tricarboxylate transporter receptor subunit TctC
MVTRKEKTDMRRGNFSCLIPWLGILLLMAAWVHPVQSQDKYPVRNIEIICPYSAGGSTDLSARMAADYARKRWGVPVNVTNKPGGNSVPACVEVYTAKPDGYTLLADTQNSSAMLPVAVKPLPFKVLDRTFIAIWNMTPMVIFVPANSAIKNLNDVAAEVRRDPETFTWGSMGGVGAQDYCIRQFLKAIGVDARRTKPVMCPGAPQVIALTGGGHIKLGAGAVSSALPGLNAKVVRAIAITGEARAPELPDLPTFKESGYPTVTGFHYNGLSGPPNTPASVQEMWGKLFQDMLKDPEVLEKMKKMGLVAFYRNPSETREFVVKQTEEIEILWGTK